MGHVHISSISTSLTHPNLLRSRPLYSLGGGINKVCLDDQRTCKVTFHHDIVYISSTIVKRQSKALHDINKGNCMDRQG